MKIICIKCRNSKENYQFPYNSLVCSSCNTSPVDNSSTSNDLFSTVSTTAAIESILDTSSSNYDSSSSFDGGGGDSGGGGSSDSW